jgi:hypothetical protein
VRSGRKLVKAYDPSAEASRPQLAAAKPKLTEEGRLHWSNSNYAALIAELTTSPDEARLAAMPLDDLRFLLRNNGISSHNMLKLPVVRCYPHASSM